MNDNGKNLTVGVIGGMGPAATLDLFKKILALTPASCDEEHLNIQIDNNPVPGAKREPLCERASRLEACGVDFIVIPCNAAHEHYQAVQDAVKIPVVNMIRQAVKTAIQSGPNITKVGVLAWHETLTAGIYQKMLTEYRVIPVIPEKTRWQPIIDLVNVIKAGDCAIPYIPTVLEIGQNLIAQGAQAIILGCTELPLAISQKNFSVPVIDTTLVLAQTVVNLAMGKVNFEALTA